MSKTQLRGTQTARAYLAPAIMLDEWFDKRRAGRKPQVDSALALIEQLLARSVCKRGDPVYNKSSVGRVISCVGIVAGVLCDLKGGLIATTEFEMIAGQHLETVRQLVARNGKRLPAARLQNLELFVEGLVRRGRNERGARA